MTNKQKFIVLKSREIMCLCSSSPILQSNFSLKKRFYAEAQKKNRQECEFFSPCWPLWAWINLPWLLLEKSEHYKSPIVYFIRKPKQELEKNKNKSKQLATEITYWSQQITNIKKIPGIDLVDPAIQEKTNLKTIHYKGLFHIF